MKSRITTLLAVIMAIAEAILVLVSWLLSATMTEGVRSLLSSEGVRWLAVHITDTLLTPLLAWMLLASMAWGCVRRSRLLRSLTHHQSYRERLAIRMTVLSTAAYVCVVSLLVAVPHAVLLSATGRLWPSPFSAAIVPILCFGTTLVAIVYGLVGRHFRSVADICQAFVYGLTEWASLFFLYVLAAQFFSSLRFVFTF